MPSVSGTVAGIGWGESAPARIACPMKATVAGHSVYGRARSGLLVFGSAARAVSAGCRLAYFGNPASMSVRPSVPASMTYQFT